MGDTRDGGKERGDLRLTLASGAPRVRGRLGHRYPGVSLNATKARSCEGVVKRRSVLSPSSNRHLQGYWNHPFPPQVWAEKRGRDPGRLLPSRRIPWRASAWTEARWREPLLGALVVKRTAGAPRLLPAQSCPLSLLLWGEVVSFRLLSCHLVPGWRGVRPKKRVEFSARAHTSPQACSNRSDIVGKAALLGAHVLYCPPLAPSTITNLITCWSDSSCWERNLAPRDWPEAGILNENVLAGNPETRSRVKIFLSTPWNPRGPTSPLHAVFRVVCPWREPRGCHSGSHRWVLLSLWLFLPMCVKRGRDFIGG